MYDSEMSGAQVPMVSGEQRLSGESGGAHWVDDATGISMMYSGVHKGDRASWRQGRSGA